MFVVEGVKTTIPLHRQILRSEEFQTGDIYTKLLEHLQDNHDNQARTVEMA
jgi:biotin carboxylase